MKKVIFCALVSSLLAACASNPSSGSEEVADASGAKTKRVCETVRTNNTGQRMDPAVYTAEGIKRIVTNLRVRLPGSRILIIGIMPRHFSPLNEMRKRNEEINRLISSLDNDDSVEYLDIGLEFVNEDGTLRKDLMPDLLHPNAAGYRVWAEAMEPAIERIMRN